MVPMHSQIARRQFLRGVGLVAGGVAVLGAAGACGGGDSAQGQNNQGSGGGQENFSGEVAVAHLQAIVAGSPFLVADELGFFEEEGLNLDLVSFPGGTDTIRGIATGMPFGMPATLPGLIAYQKGQRELRLVSGAVNTALVNFLVPTASKIKTIDDLEGTKIAVSQPGSITTYFADRIAREVGLTPGKDVELLSVGGPPDAWTATEQGLADVSWSTAPISTSLIDSGEARLLFEANEYVTSWVDNTYWTTQSFIDESPDVLQSMLRAMQKAITTIQNDLDTAAPAYAKRAKLDPAVARAALEQIGPSMGLELDMDGIEENVRAGADLGQLDAKDVDLEKVIVRDFIDEL